VEELSPFQAALAARRDVYNARFRLARHRSRNLDASAFLAHLRDAVAPIVDGCGADPLPVADALVELSLELAPRGQDAQLWRLLGSMGALVGAAPRRVPVALANALHHLRSSPTGRVDEWVSTMISLGALTDRPDSLLDAGAVAAWRCGLAQLRSSALQRAGHVRPDLLEIALGSEVDFPRLVADPWFDPAQSGLRVVRRVGAFRGFGGVFARPPLVSTSDGCWFATDGAGSWRMYADRFGVAFRRVASVPAAGQNDGLTLDSGKVTDAATGQVLDVAELAEATSWASSGGTLAATTPWSHAILFVAST
jgi:hypothetical protein